MWSSRKFRAWIVASISALVLYFGDKYLPPSIYADVDFVMGIIGGGAGLYIIGTALEDAAFKRSGQLIHTWQQDSPNCDITQITETDSRGYMK